MWALTDGFFIDDLRNGEDVSEVIFYSGITAGASVGGRAGIDVGLISILTWNFDDPNNDGKIRLTELADNLANSPMAMFDTSMTLQARAFAYLDLFFYRKSGICGRVVPWNCSIRKKFPKKHLFLPPSKMETWLSISANMLLKGLTETLPIMMMKW